MKYQICLKRKLNRIFEITNTNFINLRLSKDYLYKYSAFNKDYLPSLNQSILIDYGGPNIGKALHVGHLRTLNIGRAIYNLNKFAETKLFQISILGLGYASISNTSLYK